MAFNSKTTVLFGILLVAMILFIQTGESEGFIGIKRRSCGCPDTDKCNSNCISRFGGRGGRCAGLFNLACECLIGDHWTPKANRCG
ncbi:unnamed protein product [Adineta steineri]|uniref:Uncharacterized protein n=1 Tax=Adineta steineri TaxID=433720 RepID=A0A819ZMZ9_9BILA|nr:unnamed protein product [Adineta steineri]CAF4172485.1 unnamed protein product [Adineta steineri]